MADLIIELSYVLGTGGRITFYVDLKLGRELGYITPSDSEYAAAKEKVAVYSLEMSRQKPLAGWVAPTMRLEETRVRELITAGGSWGRYSREKRG